MIFSRTKLFLMKFKRSMQTLKLHYRNSFYNLKLFIFMMFFFIIIHFDISGQETNTESGETNKWQDKKYFKIGFLQTDFENELGLGWYEKIRYKLEADTEFKKNLNNNDLYGILILPAKSYRSFVQRMSHNEFDLVFCSAEIYVEQTGEYEPILQHRTQRDIFGRGKVFQKGEIWVNYNSPFFKNTNPSKEEIKKYIESETMAFETSQSAPGYIYPRLKLIRDYNILQPGNFLFCDSSEEVVKYLINDLAKIGACESGVVDEILRKNGIERYKDKLLKKIIDTELLPTAPVCILKKWTPDKSELGRILSQLLKKIYSDIEGDHPRLEPSSEEYYKNLKEEMDYFYNLKNIVK